VKGNATSPLQGRGQTGQGSNHNIVLTEEEGEDRVAAMPRQLRVEFPGAIYHVMSRGDRCEKIFQDDVDRQDFKGRGQTITLS
jgi:hypothetical protein